VARGARRPQVGGVLRERGQGRRRGGHQARRPPEFFARHSIADIEAFGLSDGDRVDLVSEFTNLDGELQERRAKDFMVVAYSTPRGNAAAYYPETNPLVALDHVAKKSNTPVSKAIVIRLEPA
jgi:anaerobic selenocysteine-containing dehydrogenase